MSRAISIGFIEPEEKPLTNKSIGGHEIGDAIKEALGYASESGEPFTFEFNGIYITARAGDDPHALHLLFQAVYDLQAVFDPMAASAQASSHPNGQPRRGALQFRILEADEHSLTAEDARTAYPHIDFESATAQALGDRAAEYDVENFSVHHSKGCKEDEIEVYVPLKPSRKGESQLCLAPHSH